MIILIGGEKGGTGKSTVATTLAAMRSARGHDVLLVDADPQGSASMWSAARDEQPVEKLTCVAKTGAALRKDVAELAHRFGDVIIDAGGRDSKELRASMVVADKLYIPIQPSSADVWTLDNMAELVEQAHAYGNLDVFVVLSRAYTDTRIPETKDAIGLLADYDQLAWSGVTLSERVDYRRAFGAGLSVEELDASSKASDEARALYTHAFPDAQ